MAQPHGKNAWVELWIGYNDFTTGGISAATLETSLASFVSTVHSLGWKIQVVVDPDVASYTSMFLANAYGADSVCNYLSDLGGQPLPIGHSDVAKLSSPLYIRLRICGE